MPGGVAIAIVLMLGAAECGAQAPATPGTRQDATTKRCQAAQRRIERQNEVLVELDGRLQRDRDARARCEVRRTCARLDRALKAHEARRKRYEQQLAQYEADARRICERD